MNTKRIILHTEVVRFYECRNGVETGTRTHQISHDLDMILGYIRNNDCD